MITDVNLELRVHDLEFIIIRTKFSSVRHNYDYRCSLRVKRKSKS